MELYDELKQSPTFARLCKLLYEQLAADMSAHPYQIFATVMAPRSFLSKEVKKIESETGVNLTIKLFTSFLLSHLGWGCNLTKDNYVCIQALQGSLNQAKMPEWVRFPVEFVHSFEEV